MKTKKEIEQKKYKVSTIEQASFLVSRNHFILENQSIEGRFFFVFLDTPELQADMKDYISGAGLVGVRGLFSAYSRCKDLLWRWKRGES